MHKLDTCTLCGADEDAGTDFLIGLVRASFRGGANFGFLSGSELFLSDPELPST